MYYMITFDISPNLVTLNQTLHYLYYHIGNIGNIYLHYVRSHA